MASERQLPEPRARFARHLDYLIEAAEVPNLDWIAGRVSPSAVTGKRISAWRTGENVPRDFADLEPLLEVLMARARTRRQTSHQLPPQALDMESWRRWHRAASRVRSSVPPVSDPRSDSKSRPFGSPVSSFTGAQLEVHRAIEADDLSVPLPELPLFVRRSHDLELRESLDRAIGAEGGMIVLVGNASSGKTRSCWETVQHLDDWLIWHPLYPSRAEELLAHVGEVRPKTVIWLNESQYYLGGANGEAVASALRDLLRDPRRLPTVILGTLWPEHLSELTARTPGITDPHAQARELLASIHRAA